jgi:hypothetical protein
MPLALNQIHFGQICFHLYPDSKGAEATKPKAQVNIHFRPFRIHLNESPPIHRKKNSRAHIRFAANNEAAGRINCLASLTFVVAIMFSIIATRYCYRDEAATQGR